MSFRILAEGIYQLSDARYLNALETDILLGFSFDSLDPAALSIEKAKDILQWLYEPAAVATFGLHQDQAEIRYVLENIGASAIQLPAAHQMSVASEAWFTFVRVPVISIFEIPVLQNHNRLFHILDFSAGKITLDALRQHPLYHEWKKLIQQDRVFIRVLPSDYTSAHHQEWQPGGWAIQAPQPESGIDLPVMYGDFLEAL